MTSLRSHREEMAEPGQGHRSPDSRRGSFFLTSLPEEGREGPKTSHPVASQRGHLSEVQRTLVGLGPQIVTQVQKLCSTKACNMYMWFVSVLSQQGAY